MFKKIIALTLIFAMLVPFTAAAAADEPSESRSMEEILDEYHRRAFEAQAQGDTRSASANSRSGGKTLEEETVDALTEAGYEAYNVTAGNYDTLEAQLQTDFAAMGLDPEGSYIIVIHGQPEGGETNGNSRMIDPPTEEDFGGDGSGFDYTHGGITYSLRYVTVTALLESELFVSSGYLLSDIEYFDEIADIFGEYILAAAGEKFIKGLVEESVTLIPYVGTICTVASILVDAAGVFLQDPLSPLDPGTLDFRAGTAWTRSYIQVHNEITNNWHTAQCSSYATFEACFLGDYVYDPVTNAPKRVEGIIQQGTEYSPYYYHPAQRMARAVEGYLNGCVLYDGTGDIEFYFTNPNDTNPATNKISLFVHEESAAELLPLIDEE